MSRKMSCTSSTAVDDGSTTDNPEIAPQWNAQAPGPTPKLPVDREENSYGKAVGAPREIGSKRVVFSDSPDDNRHVSEEDSQSSSADSDDSDMRILELRVPGYVLRNAGVERAKTVAAKKDVSVYIAGSRVPPSHRSDRSDRSDGDSTGNLEKTTRRLATVREIVEPPRKGQQHVHMTPPTLENRPIILGRQGHRDWLREKQGHRDWLQRNDYSSDDRDYGQRSRERIPIQVTIPQNEYPSQHHDLPASTSSFDDDKRESRFERGVRSPRLEEALDISRRSSPQRILYYDHSEVQPPSRRASVDDSGFAHPDPQAPTYRETRWLPRRTFEERSSQRRNGSSRAASRHNHVSRNRSRDLNVYEPQRSDWLDYLKAKSLLAEENEVVNWSGKGQHVEYSDQSEVPLVGQKILGHSANCVVEQCRLKHSIIARKTITCSRRMTKEDALIEVEHLQRLRHPHIVQMVGSYVLGQKFAILLYPAAEFNLEEFMRMCLKTPEESLEKTSLLSFTSCLLETLRYVHSERIRHNDIKPKNILVRPIMNEFEPYRVYLADFGIAKAYQADEDMETNGATAFTRTYCAPEVALQDWRGPKADVFSLGCVFAEIFTVLADRSLEQFAEARENEGDGTFHNSRAEVLRWLAGLEPSQIQGFVSWPKWFSMIKQMLEKEPADRPSAVDLLGHFKALKDCCTMDPVSFDANDRGHRSERIMSYDRALGNDEYPPPRRQDLYLGDEYSSRRRQNHSYIPPDRNYYV